MTPTEASHWLRVRAPVSAPRMRLLCVPYAGSGATVFHTWPDHVPASVEIRAVQLPGRQDRFAEPGLTSVDAIVDRLLEALEALPPAPVALFGHSLGALVAFELAHRLQAAGRPPVALVASARRAPQLSPDGVSIRALPDAAFVRALQERYGAPAVLSRDADLLAIALPALRADFTALETYVHASGARLDVPITVLRGLSDPIVSEVEAAAWSALTTRGTSVHTVAAGHLLLETHRDWVLARVAEALTASAQPDVAVQ